MQNLHRCRVALHLHSKLSEFMYDALPKDAGSWNPLLMLEDSLLKLGATETTSGIFYCSLVELGHHSVLEIEVLEQCEDEIMEAQELVCKGLLWAGILMPSSSDSLQPNASDFSIFEPSGRDF